jgi:hypothetical protein
MSASDALQEYNYYRPYNLRVVKPPALLQLSVGQTCATRCIRQQPSRTCLQDDDQSAALPRGWDVCSAVVGFAPEEVAGHRLTIRQDHVRVRRCPQALNVLSNVSSARTIAVATATKVS